MSAYQGASHTDLALRDWQPFAGSADADLLPELDTLTSRSRDLARNDGLMAGGLQTHRDKVVGAVLLLWIGIKLIAPHEDEHAGVQSSDKLWAAVQTVIVADLVMSVDNVIAIAGAAHSAGAHQMLLVTLGLLISIPIIVWGSQLVIKLMERFPVVIVLGGMLLGWIGGSMAVSDPLFVHPEQWLWSPKLPQSPLLHYGAAAAGALLVLGLGQWLKRRAEAAQTAQA